MTELKRKRFIAKFLTETKPSTVTKEGYRTWRSGPSQIYDYVDGVKTGLRVFSPFSTVIIEIWDTGELTVEINGEKISFEMKRGN